MLRIIISPAKKMNVADDFPVETTVPRFLERTEALKSYLQSQNYETLKGIWKCNDQIAAQNVARLDGMQLTGRVTPAVIAYEGIQYQSMAPAVMEEKHLDYLREHLYILSGFYGILRAFDGVVPYRLEMQAMLDWMYDGTNVTSLYDYWGDRLYHVLAEVQTERVTIINLASREYSKAIEPWLEPGVSMVNCIFGELAQGKVKVKATAAKMARGAMVRYMAEHQVTEVDQLKAFSEMGYQYQEQLSGHETLVFVRNV